MENILGDVAVVSIIHVTKQVSQGLQRKLINKISHVTEQETNQGIYWVHVCLQMLHETN